MDNNYYLYQECYKRYKESGDALPLGRWCERFGDDYWTGSCYKLEEGECLYPVYQEISPDDYEIVDWEVR